jgi:anti-sigma regulatory factor (Ser/Thr protein kinase)
LELKEFIAASLRQVIEAIEDAVAHAKEHNADINPSTLEFRADSGQTRIWDDKTGRIASEIEFDVAVTASSTAEKGVEGELRS